MKKMIFAILGIFLVLGIAGLTWANDTTYSPKVQSMEMLVGDTQSYALKITSPTDLDKNFYKNDKFPQTTDLNIEPTAWPSEEGATQAGAQALVSADASTLTFNGTGEDHTVIITFNATSAIPGSYQYVIQSKKRFGIASWGNGSAQLMVTVSAPGMIDTTPPSISILYPNNGQSNGFCLGGTTVGVQFEAQDAESIISGAGADVNGKNIALSSTGLNANQLSAAGSFKADYIGKYTLTARAQSAGGIGDATAIFTVNYDLTWLPPLSLGKTRMGGSDVPIKFTVRDCNGNFIHDESVQVVVYEVQNDGDVEGLKGIFGNGAASVRIDDLAGQYIINFKTLPGGHNYRADVYFADFTGNSFLQGSKQFSVR